MLNSRDSMLAELIKAYGGDNLFRPSAASRWLNCPGSVQLIAKAPKDRRTSNYALEGTAAHVVAQHALEGLRQPDEWTDRMVKLDDKGMEGWFVDEEMVESVSFYTDVISTRWTPQTQQYTERKLTLASIDADDPMFAQCSGTADCVHANAAKRKLTVFDLKYGKGVMVAGDAPQLRIYALMGMLQFFIEGGWREVETVVVQPRAVNERERLKSAIFDPAELMTGFLGDVATAMEAALVPDPVLKPDPTGGWCRWCPAKAICPALREQALHLARDVFDAIPPYTSGSELGPLPDQVFVGTLEEPRPSITPARTTVVLPAVTDLDPGEISTILHRRALWDTWIAGVEHRAVQLLESGTRIPDCKLERRSGNRKWNGEEPATLDQLRQLGLNVGDCYSEPKLRSPAQIEKLLPKDRRPLIEGLVERPLGAVTLVVGKGEEPSRIVESAFGPITES